MELTHIEHLGIAVKSIEACLPYYEGVLGLKCYNIEVVADQKVKTAFFKVGQTKIELLEPTSEDSTIAKFIEKKGEGIHHIAFAVPDVQAALNEAEVIEHLLQCEACLIVCKLYLTLVEELYHYLDIALVVVAPEYVLKQLAYDGFARVVAYHAGNIYRASAGVHIVEIVLERSAVSFA